MKKAFLSLFVAMSIIVHAYAQNCSTCGGIGASRASGNDVGPDFNVSLGAVQYGQPAGDLTFSSAVPDPLLYTPAALQFDSSNRTDVTIVTSTEGLTLPLASPVITTDAVLITNTYAATNVAISGGITNTTVLTNTYLAYNIVSTTNTTAYNTYPVIRQAITPQVLADIPAPPTANGYVINFYYASQVGSVNPDGTYSVSGTPFITWIITNTAPATINQLQISEYGNVPSYGLMKQWNYTYSTNTGTWAVQFLGGAIQENILVTNLSSSIYQISNSIQAPSGAIVKQVEKTYQIFSWGTGLIQTAVGADSAPQVTSYAYPSSPNAGSQTLVEWVTNADGSVQQFYSYDVNGRPMTVYSTFQDNPQGKETDYTYDPSDAGVSGSGDDGTINSNVARRVIGKINGTEISRQYAVFPSVGIRLDIQCTVPGASWNDSGNLFTTNEFYTSGPNQNALQAVIRPDGTETTYNYITNGIYQTNIVVTGQPDSSYATIVDGVSNVTVLNIWGYTVSSASWDVKSGLAISQDIYGNFDDFGRPQQVSHLDGTTEYTQYACCGLDNTIDRDGVVMQYLYDPSKRQIGFEKIYNSTAITFTNVLDAAGRKLQSIRVGSDNSSITLGGAGYDLAGELIAQTNALGGATTHTRTNDPTTGGLIRTAINPDGGTITNFYYADGSLKSTIGTAVPGKAYGYGVDTDVNGNTCTFVAETNLNTDGSLSSEWTKTYTDIAGRTTETLYADNSYSQSFYNTQGQLWKQVDPDGVVTLYQYNAKGEIAYTATDMDRNGTIDFAGTDRVNWTTNDVTTDHGTSVQRTRIYVWTANGVNSSTLVSMVENSTDGLNAWQTQYRDASTAVTSSSQTSPGSTRVVTTTAPDNSYTINTYSYSQLISSTHYDSTSAQIGATTYTYDPHGRQYQVTDARNGTTTYGYNNADLVTSATTPNPGTIGSAPETTTTVYNTMLQPTSVVQPDGSSVINIYLLTGELGETYGSRIYPVAYTFDYAGRMKTMTNWSNFSSLSGGRVTTWSYDSYRGWLTGKTYDGGATGPSYTYTYTSAGRLASRTWARGVTTTYKYDSADSLTNVIYSDSTPGTTNMYDRLGRQGTVTWNNITDTLTYNLANQLMGESFSGGTLSGLAVTNIYDQFLRRTNLTSLNGGSALARAVYGYDNVSRLSTVSDGTNSAAYNYVANSPLVSQIAFKQNGTTRMTTSKSYDYLNRLTGISSAASNTFAFNYNYNPANQRTRNTLADGSYWIYQYDSLGQVTSGCKYWSDGTPVAGQQFDYTFDTIGNRTQTLSGGNQSGSLLRLANYTNNTLNQITSRDVPGYMDVKGVSIATNTVTVNSQTAYRKVEYFRSELPINNSTLALWTNIITTATGQTSVTGNVYVARTPEIFKYDLDGNLTNDGRWAYTWDAENRLVAMTVNTNVGPQYQLTFAYDAKGRRIQKIVATNSVTIYTDNFLYDGWNLIATLSSSSQLLSSYLWGNDLSGSQQGAGGVGGLLEVSYYGSSTTNCFSVYDGNGNEATLVNATDGTTLANYDYGPFGETIRATGPMAKANPFRFSTKYQDDESDLLYYGYRYYKPSTGTWPNRDPKGEPGFELVAQSVLKTDKESLKQRQLTALNALRSRAKSKTLIMLINMMLTQIESSDSGDLNLYEFVNNQPLQNIDPDGRYALPTVEYRDCDEAEWIQANQKCKKLHGCWSIVGTCTWVKLGVDWNGFRANVWFLIVSCMNSAPDPMPPPPNVG